MFFFVKQYFVSSHFFLKNYPFFLVGLYVRIFLSPKKTFKKKSKLFFGAEEILIKETEKSKLRFGRSR
jgi:hypothetical protein